MNAVAGTGFNPYLNPASYHSSHSYNGRFGIILRRHFANVANVAFIILVEGYENYDSQFGIDKYGHMDTKPPDMLDRYFGTDAARRVLAWLEKYRSGLRWGVGHTK